jgi:hypothetical protein
VREPANRKLSRIPERKAGAMAWGKKPRLVRAVVTAGLRGVQPGSPLATVSSSPTGFCPRKAPKSEVVGCELAREVRIPRSGEPTPSPARAVPTEWLSPEERPVITMVKKKTRESCWPVFWSVASIPEAAPRSPAGTEFITAAALGDANIPMPQPMRKSSPPISQ